MHMCLLVPCDHEDEGFDLKVVVVEFGTRENWEEHDSVKYSAIRGAISDWLGEYGPGWKMNGDVQVLGPSGQECAAIVAPQIIML